MTSEAVPQKRHKNINIRLLKPIEGIERKNEKEESQQGPRSDVLVEARRHFDTPLCDASKQQAERLAGGSADPDARDREDCKELIRHTWRWRQERQRLMARFDPADAAGNGVAMTRLQR